MTIQLGPKQPSNFYTGRGVSNRAIREQNQPFEIVAEDVEEGQNSEDGKQNEAKIVEENKNKDSFLDSENMKQIDVPLSQERMTSNAGSMSQATV